MDSVAAGWLSLTASLDIVFIRPFLGRTGLLTAEIKSSMFSTGDTVNSSSSSVCIMGMRLSFFGVD